VRKCPQCGSSYENTIAFCPADGTRTEELTSVAPPDTLIGTVIDGRYRIEQRIGQGGMGVVYRATHVVLRKPFALKLIRGDQASDQSVVERFVREARAASGIGHPNIVNINDFGTMADGSVYLAMEYLDGVTLAQAMSAGPILFARALSIFIQIAGALEAAHAQGIVHRDLKPENIFLLRETNEDDFVKVLDFGIAKVKNAAAKITRTGLVFGTPHYMSPEQAAGQPVDHRSDIYSLGVIMYQVLAGELPFMAETLMALMTKHMFEPAPSLRELGYVVPSTLDALVGRCLQKKPELRHASMRELEADLRRVQLSPVSEPRPPAPLSSISIAASFAASAPPAAFTATSETLEAALLSDVSEEEDDQPIAVPKQRPVWLWAVAAGLLMMLALSLGVRSWQSPPASAAADAASGGAAAAAGAAASLTVGPELPSGLSAPLDAERAAQSAAEVREPAAAPELAPFSPPAAAAEAEAAAPSARSAAPFAKAAAPSAKAAAPSARAAAPSARAAAPSAKAAAPSAKAAAPSAKAAAAKKAVSPAPSLRAQPSKSAPRPSAKSSAAKPAAKHGGQGESLMDPWR
jgi:serine/threonine protein kinase